ncbi:MAG: SusE domain-containing protein, partial [Parafilimonas sp.]
MKNYLNKLVTIAALGMIVLSACKKEGTDVTYNGNGTAPALSSTVSDTIALSDATKDDQAVTFKWTNPNYTFSDGVSSLNVTYNL